MDLRIGKRHALERDCNEENNTYTITTKKADNEKYHLNPSTLGVFVPNVMPLNLSMDTRLKKYEPELKRIKARIERHTHMFTWLNPQIYRLNQLYPAVVNERIKHRDSPKMAKVFRSTIKVSNYSRSESAEAHNAVMESIQRNSISPMPRNNISDRVLALLQEGYPRISPQNPKLVEIGPRGTLVNKKAFDDISWTVGAAAARYLLTLVFNTETLATHTLTGKPSPAFYGRERPPKNRLDEDKVSDIIHCVRAKCLECNVREIRGAITTKCADASKRRKLTMKRKAMNFEMNMKEDDFKDEYSSDSC